MAFTTRGDRAGGLSPFFLVSNLLVWISAVIVMGIVSYWISQDNNQPSFIIYIEVIAVLTTAFFLAAFFLHSFAGFVLLFNLIFSYLWLVAVTFTASTFSSKYAGALPHTVEAFSFIAFFFLLFNVLYDWHFGYRAGRVGTTTTSRV